MMLMARVMPVPESATEMPHLMGCSGRPVAETMTPVWVAMGSKAG